MIIGRSATDRVKIKKDGSGIKAITCSCCVSVECEYLSQPICYVEITAQQFSAFRKGGTYTYNAYRAAYGGSTAWSISGSAQYAGPYTIDGETFCYGQSISSTAVFNFSFGSFGVGSAKKYYLEASANGLSPSDSPGIFFVRSSVSCPNPNPSAPSSGLVKINGETIACVFHTRPYFDFTNAAGYLGFQYTG